LGVGKNASHGFPVTGQLSWIKAEQNCFRVCDTNFSSRSDVLTPHIFQNEHIQYTVQNNPDPVHLMATYFQSTKTESAI